MRKPSVTVLLTLLDDAWYLPEWAECIRRLQPDEILVVDGGSTDGGPEYLAAQQLSHFRLTRRPMEDFGWDRSMQFNFAAEQARGDWILMLDADEVFWPPDRGPLDRAVRRVGAKIISFWFARFHLWPDNRTRLDLGGNLDPQARLWGRDAGIRRIRRCHTQQ